MAAVSETPYRIEPCLLEAYPAEVANLITEISARAATLGARLHPETAGSLAELVAIMNCFYSNRIEGHNTRPREIEAALANQLTPERRDLQLEARAHVRVQRAIDAKFAAGELPSPTSRAFVRWVHHEFYREAPDAWLRVAREGETLVMTPGEFRSNDKHDVAVGQHQPPSSSEVEAFMAYFEQRYAPDKLGRADKIVAIASAHHRLNYIHPFLDGNGRVSRLMSHAMGLTAGVGAHGLWSISRGLARGLGDAGEYLRMMDSADMPRKGELDGRGNLSTEALIEFVIWFCRVMLDQIDFMSALFELDGLRERLQAYVRRELSENAAAVADAALLRGSLQRGEASAAAGKSERTGRDALRELMEAGLLASPSPKGAVSLRFPTAVADVLFPQLFPAQAG